MTDEQVLNLDDLQQYIVLGVNAEGKHVTAQSAGLTLQDTEAMIARIQTSIDVMKIAAGVEQARSGTVVPGPKLWTPEG